MQQQGLEPKVNTQSTLAKAVKTTSIPTPTPPPSNKPIPAPKV